MPTKIDWDHILRSLAAQPWQIGQDGHTVRVVPLGLGRDLYPSGVFPLVFKITDANRCPCCTNGVAPAHRRRRIDKKWRNEFARLLCRIERLPRGRWRRKDRLRFLWLLRRVARDCVVCEGCGSVSVARDLRYDEMLSDEAEERGLFIAPRDAVPGMLFVVQPKPS